MSSGTGYMPLAEEMLRITPFALKQTKGFGFTSLCTAELIEPASRLKLESILTTLTDPPSHIQALLYVLPWHLLSQAASLQ